MALHLDPFEHDPLQRSEEAVRVTDIGHERKVSRDGIEVLAHGAMVCPACDAPVVIGDRMSAWRDLGCGFCGHQAPAREFLTRDVFDTVANEAYLIARLT